jgi:hypothetical protein
MEAKVSIAGTADIGPESDNYDVASNCRDLAHEGSSRSRTHGESDAVYMSSPATSGPRRVYIYLKRWVQEIGAARQHNYPFSPGTRRTAAI